MEVTDEMVSALFSVWFGVGWENFVHINHKEIMRRAIQAALEAAPSGNGERG